jgi:hypothetical protein
MNLEQFKHSLSQASPADITSVYLQSLWYDGKDNWEKAHALIQDAEDKTGSCIHAYLHRKEGDEWNARYWYNRAGKKMPNCSLQEEWETLVKELL